MCKVDLEVWIVNKNYASLEETPENANINLTLTDKEGNTVIDDLVSMQDFERSYCDEVPAGKYHLSISSQELDYYEIEEDIVVENDANVFEYEVIGEEMISL
ncbi:hypothetical protein [Carboxylicivirga sp. N1Y90]|uniref:hypothetical protein n=1 Tax=Carboxylicivirga fragile TaxID=3417571 RepID=UPI003D333159|nr:hypothetical protein [Marinilabiliaceae bacterium N1Y90]